MYLSIATFDHPKESEKQKGPDFHSKLAYVDLVAYKFKYRQTCSHNFTQDYLSNSTSFCKSQKEDSHEDNKRNSEKVKRFVSENILGGNEAISMSILQGVYGIGANSTRHRSKL